MNPCLFTDFAGGIIDRPFRQFLLLLHFSVFFDFGGGGGGGPSFVGLESRGRGGGDEGLRDLARIVSFARRIGRQVG